MITKEQIQSDLLTASVEQNISVEEMVKRLSSVASNSTKSDFVGKPQICLAWQVLQYIKGTGLDYFKDVLGEDAKVTHVLTTDLTPKQANERKIKNLVSSFYDAQKLRIQMGNRIYASFKNLTDSEEVDSEVKGLLDLISSEYKTITETDVSKITFLRKRLKELDSKLKYVKTDTDFYMYDSYQQLYDAEDKILRTIKIEVEKHPLWDAFFKDVKGCGPLMTAIIIASIDIRRAGHVSSLWKYAGLDTVTVTDGEGNTKTVGRSKSHLDAGYYTDKNKAIQSRKSLTYNPNLKSKLIGVLGSCMLKAGLRTAKDADGKPLLDANGNKVRSSDSYYVDIYLDYLNRLNQRSDLKDTSDAHKHNMAVRYMIKQFLRDLYVVWRDLEGLPISAPYEVEKLGNRPHKYNEKHLSNANI